MESRSSPAEPPRAPAGSRAPGGTREPAVYIRPLAALLGWGPLLAVWLPLLAITALHYATPPDHPWIHDVARRLYYLPIISAAFYAGAVGGTALALGVTLVYTPHAFITHLSHLDPASGVEKALEMVLYLVVGLVTGMVVDRERRERIRQQELARNLSTTLEELRRTRDMLLRSWRLGALGQLTAGLAHEIKNPLHAMRGTAEIVLEAMDGEGTERRMMELHLEEIDRLSNLLERFMDFARPAAPAMSQVDLAWVLGRVVQLVGAQARKQGIALESHLVTGTHLVMGDRDQLVQLFMAIVLNAMQALQESSTGRPRLEISLREAGKGETPGHVGVLRNNGPPIPDDLLESIFDPFVTTRSQGTGPGLSIATRIADLHGGYIRVHNLEGGAGVEFQVFLPVEAGKRQQPLEAEPPRAKGVHSSRGPDVFTRR